jgi:hypothetical protein
VFVHVEGVCFVNISRLKFGICSCLFLFVSEIVIVKDVPTVWILPTFYIKAGLILHFFFRGFALMRLKNCATF